MTRDEGSPSGSADIPCESDQTEHAAFQLDSILERLAWLEDQRLMAQRDRVDTEHRFSRLSEHIERLKEDFAEERQQRQVESNEECMCRQAETAALRANLEDVQIILRSAIDMKMIPLDSKVQAGLTSSRPSMETFSSGQSMETFAEEPEDEKAPECMEEEPLRTEQRCTYVSPRAPRHREDAWHDGTDAAAMVECLEVRLDSLEVHFHARLSAMEAQVGRRCDDVKAQLLARADKSDTFFDRQLEELKLTVGTGPAGFTNADAPALQQLQQSVEQLEGAISCVIRSSTESRSGAKKDVGALRTDVEDLARRLHRVEAVEPPRGPSPGAPRRCSPSRPLTRAGSAAQLGTKDPPVASRGAVHSSAAQLGTYGPGASAAGVRQRR